MQPEDFLPSTLTAALLLSLPVNGIYTQFKSVPKSLQRFCRPLLFYNENSPFDLSFGGSSFLLRHAGHNFLIATKHQLVNLGRDGSEIGIIVDEGDRQKSLGPNELNFVNVTSEGFESLEDIFVARYDSVRNDQPIDRYFLQSESLQAIDLDLDPSLKLIATFCIGYAAEMQGYDLTFNVEGDVTGANITSRWSPVYLEPCTSTGFEDDHRLALSLHPDYNWTIDHPDGLSGAPIFFLLQDRERQVHLGFGGMVTHSNGKNYAGYPASAILKVLSDSIKLG